jgi:hypothetical protein
MYHIRSLRTGTGLMALAAIMFLIVFNFSGCSDADNSPTNTEEVRAPVLPDTENLEFDFSFFDPADQLDKSNGEYDNFINAYLRTVILDVTARLVLAAPVEAFSNAINTVPAAMPNGSWRWTYDWQITGDRVGIVLVGNPDGGVVEWELSLVPDGTTEEYLWFSGTTNDNGEEGHWVFLDLDQEDFPVSGEISWGNSDHGRYLEFISREPDSNGDSLTFYDNDPEFRIEFTLGTDDDSSFIQWRADGDGSLKVPDYNDGVQACWDIYQQDVECP